MLTYDEYMKQSKDYCEALEKIKVELSNKRSEMANLAMQTVKDLEPKIPALQAKINTLNNEVNRLVQLATTTKKQSDYDENYWRTHYEELESKLNKAHDARTASFKVKDEQYDLRDKTVADIKADVMARELRFKNDQKKLQDDINMLKKSEESLEKNKSNYEAKSKASMSDLNGKINEANDEKLKQQKITEQIELQSRELVKKTQEANAVIARIGEAQKKLDEANAILEIVKKKEYELKIFDDKLDEKNAAIIADGVKNRNKSQELDHRELSLNQRESIVKIAQKELREGKVV